MILKMTLKWTALLGVVLLAAQAFGGEQQILKNQKDKENYSTGVEFVRNLKQQGGAVDLDIVIQGIKDGLTGEKLLMTEAEIRTTMAARQAGQRETMKAATDGTAPKPMSAGREDTPAIPKKQEPALPQTDQAEQNDQLAAQGVYSSTAANAGRGYNSDAQQGQSAPNRQDVQTAPLAPNGTVLSRRNQARLRVSEMKAERAKAFANETGQ